MFPGQEHLPPGTTDVMCAINDNSHSKDINYMDLTGRFPRRSLTGNQYILIVYAYAPNAILM